MSHQQSIDAALAVMQAHIDALNARDEARIAATLHFPHYRLSGVELKCWQTPDSYFADFKSRAGGDWAEACSSGPPSWSDGSQTREQQRILAQLDEDPLFFNEFQW